MYPYHFRGVLHVLSYRIGLVIESFDTLASRPVIWLLARAWQDAKLKSLKDLPIICHLAMLLYAFHAL
jgi:hypothetical protein